MKTETRQALLKKVEAVIAETEKIIRESELMMRDGLGPYDIERERVELAELRAWKWLLEQAGTKNKRQHISRYRSPGLVSFLKEQKDDDNKNCH